MAKVTVIIPVYNTQDYLRQCLDSVINQSLTDIEIICINDGSTDNSLSILKEYAAKHNRLRIMDIEHGGQGTARNMAIKEATGEYLGFVDSDDWIEKDMFEELYNSASTFATDVTVCELNHFNQAENILAQPNWRKLPGHINFDNRGFPWEELGRECFRIGSEPCNKIYRRDFIIKNNIIFAKGVYYQDVLFVYHSFVKSIAISFVKKPLYVYRIDRAGSTSVDKGKKQFDIFKVLELLQIEMEKVPNFSNLESEFLKYRFGQYLYHFNSVVKVHKKEFWYRIKSEYDKLGSSHKEVLKSSNMLLNLSLNKSYLFYNNYETASKLEARINKILFSHNIGQWLKSKLK